MGELTTVASTGDLGPGDQICVEVDDRTIALFNIDGDLHACDDTCTHRGGPLSEGDITDGAVVCPWHGASFDLDSGEGTPPAPEGVTVYEVTVEGDDVKVELPD